MNISYQRAIDSLRDFWIKWRSSRALILFIVFVALFLDNMLLTTVGKWERRPWNESFSKGHRSLLVVPIIPDYLYHLQNPANGFDETYKFLAKNCSSTELVRQQNYFVRHPVQFRRILRAHCNWSIDWAANKTETENKQRTIILENVRNTAPEETTEREGERNGNE